MEGYPRYGSPRDLCGDTSLILSFAAALAAEAILVAPGGPPTVGVPAVLELALADQGRPLVGAAPVLTGTAGAHLEPEGEVEPGRYRWEYLRADMGTDRLTARLGNTPVGSWSIEVSPRPVTPLVSGGVEEAVAGSGELTVRFPTVGVVRAEDLVVRASEGRVAGVEVLADSVQVRVEPGPRTQARVLVVGVVDLARPGQDPAFALIRLRARHTADLAVGPGSTAFVRVGRRSYGPFVAGANGEATANFEVYPGETSAEIVATDDLGNSRKISSPVPSDPNPVLVAVEVPTADPARSDVLLGAWTATGAAWSGDAPVCRTGVGGQAEAEPLSRGLYRYPVQADARMSLDLRVECGLGPASANLRVPIGSGRPAKLDLQVFPETLSADFPLAEARVTLLDGRGDRLSPEGVELTARLGEVSTMVQGGALRAEYRGEAAREAGEDTLIATWRPSPGSGEPWEVELHAASGPDGVEARARVRDRRGLPLPGVEVELSSGATRMTSLTDPSGWGWATLPPLDGAVGGVRARAGAVTREVAVFAGTRSPAPDPSAPDLSARLQVAIRAGRVRQVYLDVQPRPLPTGAGQQATILVRMLDSAGSPVRDEPVEIRASAGSVAQPEPRPDGTVAAIYTPPGGAITRTVKITASSSGGEVSTDLQLVPEAVRGSVGIGVGWIGNFGSVSSPTLAVDGTWTLPGFRGVVSGRAGISAWGVSTQVEDGFTGEDIALDVRFFPIELGVVATRRGGSLSLGAGLSMLVVPYSVNADFGGDGGLAGSGLAPPGALVHASAGWRVRSSEPFLEARYVLATIPQGSVSFAGQAGGLSLVGGYRVLW